MKLLAQTITVANSGKKFILLVMWLQWMSLWTLKFILCIQSWCVETNLHKFSTLWAAFWRTGMALLSSKASGLWIIVVLCPITSRDLASRSFSSRESLSPKLCGAYWSLNVRRILYGTLSPLEFSLYAGGENSRGRFSSVWVKSVPNPTARWHLISRIL